MGTEARKTIEIDAPAEWGSNDSTSLIAALRGRVQSTRVEAGKLLVQVINERDVESVKESIKARGLNIIEQSV